MAFLGGMGQARLGAGAQQAQLDQNRMNQESAAWSGAIQQGFNALRPLALAPFIPQLSQLAETNPYAAMMAGNLLGMPGLTQAGNIQAGTNADFMRDYGMTPSQIQSLGAESYQNSPPMIQEQIAGQMGYTPARVEGLGTADRNSFNRATGLGIVRQGQAQVEMQNRAQMAGMIQMERMRAEENVARVSAVASGDAVLTGTYGNELAGLYGRREEIQSADNITPQQRASALGQVDRDISQLIARTPQSHYQTTKQATPQEQYNASIVTDPVTNQRMRPVYKSRGTPPTYEPIESKPTQPKTPKEADESLSTTVRPFTNPVTGEVSEYAWDGKAWKKQAAPKASETDKLIFDAAYQSYQAAITQYEEDVKSANKSWFGDPEEIAKPQFADHLREAYKTAPVIEHERSVQRRNSEISGVVDMLKTMPPEMIEQWDVPRDFASLPRDQQNQIVDRGLIQLQQNLNRMKMGPPAPQQPAQQAPIGQPSPGVRQGAPLTPMTNSPSPQSGVVGPPAPGQQQLAIPFVMNGAKMPMKYLQDGQLYDLTGMKDVPPGTVGTWDAKTGEFVIPDNANTP